MADLQARISPKTTKLYPNLTWKRPSADLHSPPKDTTVKWSKTHQRDEKEDDGDPSSGEHDSSQTFSSPNKSKSASHQSSFSRLRQSSGPLSLLSRMGLASGLSENGTSSDGEEAASIQQSPSRLAQVGTTEDTHRSSESHPSPNIGSTSRDTAHVLDFNGYNDIVNSKHAQKRLSPQPSLPSSSNDKGNGFIAENRPLDNGSSLTDNGQTKCNDGLVVKPSTKVASSPQTSHKSILHNSSKSNYSPSIIETSLTPFKDNLATQKNMTLPLSQEQEFEEGQLVDSEPLPPQQVRDFLLPLVLTNAAHREREGDSDLIRHSAHSVLSDEVCSSFMDQMKEVRIEMYAHKNRSSHNPAQMQPTGEANHPPSKIGQAPPSCPRAMKPPIKTGNYMPRIAKIATESISSKDLAQPISAVSSHSHEPVSASSHRRPEPGIRQLPSPERRGFHDHNRDRRYSQHRSPRFDGHRPPSPSHSPSKISRGQPYNRPTDRSRDMVRSRSPVALATSPRQRPVGASQSSYFRDRAIRDSPEDISGRPSEVPRRYSSPPGTSSHDRMPKRRRTPSRDFRRIEGNTSPRWDTADSPQSPVYSSSPGLFGWPGADKVVSPRRSSLTHDPSMGLAESPRHRRDSRVSIVYSGLEFARRSASPPRRKQHRQIPAERPLPRTSPRHLPQPTTPNPYCQSPRDQASFEQTCCREPGEYHMEGLSPGARSMSSHLTDSAADSHHQNVESMVIDNWDMRGRVNKEVGTGLLKTSDNMGLNVLPCHNVPGVWFVKVALDNIGTLECSFDVDEVTALKWNLQHANVKVHTSQEKKLQLQICCLSQKLVQSIMDSLKPDATAQDVASAMLTIRNDWPTPGHLIIIVNPQDKNKRIWLPDKLEPPYLPVCIEDCVFEGQNIVQFIQLSDMSERMFVLFATTGPLLDDLQHDDHEESVHAPLQNTIDGGKGDPFEIGFEMVTISDLR